MDLTQLDDLTVELADALARRSDIAKALPPKLYYRMRAWRRKMRPSVPYHQLEQMVARKYEDELAASGLAKHEGMATSYSSGELRLDFGSDVSDQVKKRAITWAQRRGLKPVEASLAKSGSAGSSMLFSVSGQLGAGNCVKRVRWNCQEV